MTNYPLKQEKLNDSNRYWVRNLDRLFRGFCFIFALGIGLILLAMVLVITIEAWPAIVKYNFQLFTHSNWDPANDNYGAVALIYGTIVSSLIALILAVPIGVGTAIFLSENFLPQIVNTTLVFLIEILAAIPSVIYGLWGIFVLVPLHTSFGTWLYLHFGWFPLFSSEPNGPAMLVAGIILAIMILPIIVAISRESFICLPRSLREASFALGATRWQTIFRTLIPAALPGIMAGVMLAFGRAIGETMAVTMVIGNSTKLSISILDPAHSLTSLISLQFAGARDSTLSALMYLTLILMTITLIVNIVAEFIVDKLKAKYQ